jgi:signal transduction histidine kinase
VETSTQDKTEQIQFMMGYAAELELEVDRLRKRDQFLQHQAQDCIQRIARLAGRGERSGEDVEDVDAMAGIADECRKLDELLQDMDDPAGYNPSFDQVVSIAIRPLAEFVFRWQQRLSGVKNAVLRLDLSPESINWFPARLRHILDNLISNSLRYCDPQKGEIRVGLQVRLRNEGYELRFTDNGLGIPEDRAEGMLELVYRAAPPRLAGLGVGLAVVKVLVEQCCGTITVSSGEGRGTNVTVLLPRYDLEDHIELGCDTSKGN